MDKRIGFIGTGNMGGALIVAAAKSVAADQIIVTDYDAEKAAQAAQAVGCALAKSNDDVAKNAEYIVLAVKPHIMRDVVKGIAPALKESVQAGGKFAKSLSIEMGS